MDREDPLLGFFFYVHGAPYKCIFGPGLIDRPEARKKKHGAGAARLEIF